MTPKPAASGRSAALAPELPDVREEPDAPSGRSAAPATESPDAGEESDDDRTRRDPQSRTTEMETL